jgi:hypothetical protein
VLSCYDPGVVDRFLADPEALRTTPPDTGATPSEQVLDVLLRRLQIPRAA